MECLNNRESLYALVWKKSIKGIAEEYNISEKAVIGRCIELQVPRPLPGYWRALEAGKAPAIPPLPPLRSSHAHSYIITAQMNNLAESEANSQVNKEAVKRKIRKPQPVHRKTSGAKILHASRQILLSAPVTSVGFLKPTKKKLLDINVSLNGFKNAEAFLLKFFDSLEKCRMIVRLRETSETFSRREISACEENSNFFCPSLWKPSHESVICRDGICVGFSLVEMTQFVPSKKVNDIYVRDDDMLNWLKGSRSELPGYHLREHIPCGRFRLQLYSPYHQDGWCKVFSQTKNSSLLNQMPKIIKEVIAALGHLKKELISYKRDSEHTHIKKVRFTKENRDMTAQKEVTDKKCREELQNLIVKWTTERHIMQFFDEADAEIRNYPPEQQKQLRKRLNIAKAALKYESPLQSLLAWRTPDERLLDL